MLQFANTDEEKVENVEKEEECVWIDRLKSSDSAAGDERAVEW